MNESSGDIFLCMKCGATADSVTELDGEFVCAKCYVKGTLRRMKEGDTVNAPSHYTYGKVECRQAIEAVAGKQWYLGTAIKYIWRAEHKGNPRQDIEKAIQNLKFYLEELQ